MPNRSAPAVLYACALAACGPDLSPIGPGPYDEAGAAGDAVQAFSACEDLTKPLPVSCAEKSDTPSPTCFRSCRYRADLLHRRLLASEIAERLSPALVSDLDANHDGRLDMEDYALFARNGEAWKAFYVGLPGPSDAQGDGRFSAPFRLWNGNEYDFNKQLRPLLDRGVNVDVIFLDGTYLDVRLQIIKAGSPGADLIALEDPTGPPTVIDGVPSYRPTTYRFTSRCNTSGRNCRVPLEAFTMGPNTNSKLVLRGMNPGRAIFRSRDFEAVHKNIYAAGLTISGATFTASPSYAFDHINANKISNVVVTGLGFRNYTNGISPEYAERVVIKNCEIVSTGSTSLSYRAQPQNAGGTKYVTDEAIGTVALGTGSDAQLVVFKNNRIIDSWNSINPQLTDSQARALAQSTVGLIHPIYVRHSSDVIFLGNQISNSSGVHFKLGFYAGVRSDTGAITSEYPEQSWHRRVFALNNTFTQDKVFNRYKHAVVSDVVALIHENSVVADALTGRRSTGARGVVWSGNSFERVSGDLIEPMAAVRVEWPDTSMPVLKDWYLSGNAFRVGPTRLLNERIRGSRGMSASLDLSTSALAVVLGLSSQAQSSATPWSPVVASKFARDLLAPQGPLASPSPERDATVQAILVRGGIPGLDLPLSGP